MTIGKPEAATTVDKLLMMGKRMPETCWDVFKWQAINLRGWCIWLVDLFEYMTMHGLTNPKFNLVVYYSETVILDCNHVRDTHQLNKIQGSHKSKFVVTIINSV